MNHIKYTIKPDPDALDLTNPPQHLLSPSTENVDDEEDEEYLHSEDEQHHELIQETSDFMLKVLFHPTNCPRSEGNLLFALESNL